MRRLLAGGDYLAAMFCGDDLTDVTGFEALHDWAARDARRAACAVAAVTDGDAAPGDRGGRRAGARHARRLRGADAPAGRRRRG